MKKKEQHRTDKWAVFKPADVVVVLLVFLVSCINKISSVEIMCKVGKSIYSIQYVPTCYKAMMRVSITLLISLHYH